MTDITTRIDHTAKAFDTDLQEITRKVAEMGGLVERQIADSVQALVDRDIELGERVIGLDPTIDALQREVEDKCILTIARRQPMAVDLREIVGAMRVCNDLERIGDHAKHIGKRVVALDGDFNPQKLTDEELRFLTQIRRYSSNLNESDRKLLLAMVKKFAATAIR